MGYRHPPAHRTRSFPDRARYHALSIILQIVCAFAFLDIVPATIEFNGPSAASSRAQVDPFTAILNSPAGEEDDVQSPTSPTDAVAPNLFALAVAAGAHLTGTFDGTPQRFGEFAPAYPARAPPLVSLS